MIWVVVDTNTLISGLGWGGAPSRVVDHILEGRIILIESRPLLDELTRVLHYDKLADVFDDPFSLSLLIESVAIHVEPTIKVELIADEPDNRLLEAAQAGNADFLITGDKEVLEQKFFEGTQILTATQFLETFEGPGGRT